MREKLRPSPVWRSLLTETLPYEVPVIFANEQLYASLIQNNIAQPIFDVLAKFRAELSSFTIPYNYHISKDETRTTTLSIVHPRAQVSMAKFYEGYRHSILDYCAKSTISLRRPVAETSTYTSANLATGISAKLGIPHIDPQDGDIDASHITSYFAYGPCNLLGKFIDSSGYRRLEQKFRYQRTIDVVRCFFNIYTHSITWAVKGKPFAKGQANVYSFEEQFDKLMQHANYNETNGIVVGPEISRIFAEIIFQEIDRRLLSRLPNLSHNKNYAVRRYVDDYFIYANSTDDLDLVNRCLGEELESFKLFINHQKTMTSSRPFVSGITLARSELSKIVSMMQNCILEANPNVSIESVRGRVKDMRRLSLDMRLICERYKISFSSVSGWLLSTLRALMDRLIEAINAAELGDLSAAMTDMASRVLEMALYIVALDLRVRSTYSLCQIAAVIDRLSVARSRDTHDRLIHILSDAVLDLIRAQIIISEQEHAAERERDSVELFNLLIIGARYIGNTFLQSSEVRSELSRISKLKYISYFSYITVKFCWLKDRVTFQKDLDLLNARVLSKVTLHKAGLLQDTQIYLLACDYLSAPDVSPNEKRQLIETLVGGKLSNASAVDVGTHLRFADWDGVRIEHVLARKQLRPVYAWM